MWLGKNSNPDVWYQNPCFFILTKNQLNCQIRGPSSDHPIFLLSFKPKLHETIIYPSYLCSSLPTYHSLLEKMASTPTIPLKSRLGHLSYCHCWLPGMCLSTHCSPLALSSDSMTPHSRGLLPSSLETPLQALLWTFKNFPVSVIFCLGPSYLFLDIFI